MQIYESFRGWYAYALGYNSKAEMLKNRKEDRDVGLMPSEEVVYLFLVARFGPPECVTCPLSRKIIIYPRKKNDEAFRDDVECFFLRIDAVQNRGSVSVVYRTWQGVYRVGLERWATSATQRAAPVCADWVVSPQSACNTRAARALERRGY